MSSSKFLTRDKLENVFAKYEDKILIDLLLESSDQIEIPANKKNRLSR